MAFRVILTEPALADLEDIMNWSFDQYPNTSKRFGTALLNHVDLLERFPALGAPVKGFPGVRRLVHFPLHVYYRLNAERESVEILRFLHAMRKKPQILS
jgi:plasmid stabilization system protein ParE